jgi:hypothetical protein
MNALTQLNSIPKCQSDQLSKTLRLISLPGSNIQIDCFSGSVWITWPKAMERTLNRGDTFKISTRGKVCILAGSDAVILIFETGGIWHKIFKGFTQLPVKLFLWNPGNNPGDV